MRAPPRLPRARAAAGSLFVSLAIAGLGCARRPPPPGPLASALVALAADFGAEPEAVADAWSALEAIAARIEARQRRSGAEPIDDMKAVIFDELKFEREIDSGDPRFFALSSVLAVRRGSCLGLGALALALAERLRIPLDGVMVPGHFFVRTRGAAPRNIELLRRGETMPDAWYRTKYGSWPEGNSIYFRPITVSEMVGLHWFNAGNFLRGKGDLAAARHAFERAAEEFPDFAEAHASVGAVRQLEGALPEAEVAYDRAARARADLPGLKQNRALLKIELDPHSPLTRSPPP